MIKRDLAALFNLGVIGDWTDGQLLERFSTERGEAAELAFAALVERHGPMVLRVCRSFLRDSHDANDAFQATFLVLVRKARGLWVRDSLGPWLHQTAYRTALYSRSAAARRARHERAAARQRGERQIMTTEILEPALHIEINRLPARDRAVIVLCDLEGHSHEQAARSLGCPVGTIKSRQARARQRLRQRLKQESNDLAGLGMAAFGNAPVSLPALSQSLAHETARAAMQAISARVAATPAVLLLTQGVMRTMLLTSVLKVGSVVLGVGATLSSVALFARQGDPVAAKKAAVAAADGKKAVVREVERGPLEISIVERGTLASSRNQDVVNEVEGATTILSILPEGSRVKKGDLVAELDSAALRDRLTNQEIDVKRAQADLEQAMKTREVAEISIAEWREGEFAQEKARALNEIKVAEARHAQANERLDRASKARDRIREILNRKSATEVTANDVLAQLEVDDRVEQRKLELVQAAIQIDETRRNSEQSLELKFRRQLLSLENQLEKAKSDELAKRAAYELERAKLEKLARQIDKCKLLAPDDGLLVYASVPNGQNVIEEGATVRERQRIFSVPDLSKMRVKAWTQERWVDQLKIGQKVRIKVDAFPAENFQGKVTMVAPLPNPEAYGGRRVKVYETWVEIDNPIPALRPGMTAQVTMIIKELDDVIRVPETAVIARGSADGKYWVFVINADGNPEMRPVTLGATNEKDIEVQTGLKPGERVVLNPNALLPPAPAANTAK